MKSFVLCSILTLSMTLTGCATMVRGTSEKLSLNSTPEGAVAKLSDGRSCVTPCQIKAKRNATLIVTYKKKHCDPAQITVTPTVAGSGILLGGLVDYADGAVYNLEPNPANVLLTCHKPKKQHRA